MAREEIGRLSGERPNDSHTIESNKKQCDLLSILVDGFAKLAAALMEYSERRQPILREKPRRLPMISVSNLRFGGRRMPERRSIGRFEFQP
jgi:hypothetical protein